jgi:hypothetical protein
MTFEDMESVLGYETVTAIQRAIASTLQASDGDHHTVAALRGFLVSMLAAIVTTKTYLPHAQRLAAEDAAQLKALVVRIKEIGRHRPVTPAQHGSAVADTTATHNVIPFRQGPCQPRPEAEPPMGREALSHAASLRAARSAIARKKELTAQRREVLARSLALLAQSWSLRTSLHAVQLGRHS